MSIYDEIFATDRRYNGPYTYKLKIVLEWVKRNGFKNLLDVGCGRGHYLKQLSKNNIKATGLEPSKYIADILTGYQIINDDILGLAKQGRQWEALICMDVLEHIELTEVEETVKALVELSDQALLGIANHSDVWRGVELHLIQEGPAWWGKLLSLYYSSVSCIYESERYFIFKAER